MSDLDAHESMSFLFQHLNWRYVRLLSIVDCQGVSEKSSFLLSSLLCTDRVANVKVTESSSLKLAGQDKSSARQLVYT